MKRKIVFVLVFMSVAVAIAFTPVLQGISMDLNAYQVAAKTGNSKIVGSIKNPNIRDGCGCTLQLPSESQKIDGKNIFARNINAGLSSDIAWMNIEGKDTKLRRVKTTEPPGKLKPGTRFQEVYLAPRTKVQIDYVVDSACKPEAQDCEVTGYNANITVTRNRSKQIVKTVGSCGC